jgi:dihydroorotate dehydrogenase
MTTLTKKYPLLIQQPIYDFKKSYQDNVKNGPQFNHPLPERTFPDKSKWIDCLGFKVASPVGVPAGPLLNSDWTTLAAHLGFDIVTYKTIRSYAYPGHPLPNVIFVHSDKPYHPGDTVTEEKESPQNMSQVAITNSFGMPSMSPEFLYHDIKKAKNYLRHGQLLIVSVVGTPSDEIDLADDFIRTAKIAVQSGAQVLEANFSCPNVCSREGTLYNDPEQSYNVAHKLVKAVAPVPVLIKVGTYSSYEFQRKVLQQLARAGVRGVCGINSVSMKVINEQGQPALGKDRNTSGICGAPILNLALEFIQNARKIIDQDKLEIELFGCGGVSQPEDFDKHLEAGASITFTATGMMWDPYLAMRWHTREER